MLVTDAALLVVQSMMHFCAMQSSQERADDEVDDTLVLLTEETVPPHAEAHAGQWAREELLVEDGPAPSPTPVVVPVAAVPHVGGPRYIFASISLPTNPLLSL